MRYRRKPDTIEADRFDGSLDSALRIQSKYSNFIKLIKENDLFAGQLAIIQPFVSFQTADAGDWICTNNPDSGPENAILFVEKSRDFPKRYEHDEL